MGEIPNSLTELDNHGNLNSKAMPSFGIQNLHKPQVELVNITETFQK